ncbi:hypothetical protein BCR39DRAFT_562158 [Naematelia encephala]|uniref:Uncharacterized protein n=1 Tax=Naematelia encephala TaxID=71784 RepID=A0A1Y2AK00_9TREE|nr:hypothetical protein BCR39DRAFT_562158 [Naematelia encephala]
MGREKAASDSLLLRLGWVVNHNANGAPGYKHPDSKFTCDRCFRSLRECEYEAPKRISRENGSGLQTGACRNCQKAKQQCSSSGKAKAVRWFVEEINQDGNQAARSGGLGWRRVEWKEEKIAKEEEAYVDLWESFCEEAQSDTSSKSDNSASSIASDVADVEKPRKDSVLPMIDSPFKPGRIEEAYGLDSEMDGSLDFDPSSHHPPIPSPHPSEKSPAGLVDMAQRDDSHEGLSFGSVDGLLGQANSYVDEFTRKFKKMWDLLASTKTELARKVTEVDMLKSEAEKSRKRMDELCRQLEEANEVIGFERTQREELQITQREERGRMEAETGASSRRTLEANHTSSGCQLIPWFPPAPSTRFLLEFWGLAVEELSNSPSTFASSAFSRGFQKLIVEELTRRGEDPTKRSWEGAEPEDFAVKKQCVGQGKANGGVDKHQ